MIIKGVIYGVLRKKKKERVMVDSKLREVSWFGQVEEMMGIILKIEDVGTCLSMWAVNLMNLRKLHMLSNLVL